MITGDIEKGDAVVHDENGLSYLVVSTVLMRTRSYWAKGVLYSPGRGHPTRTMTDLFVRPEDEFRHKFTRIPKP